MNSRKLALLTVLTALSLMFFYIRSINRNLEISINGDEFFKRTVLEGLRTARLNFEISEKAGIVFDQSRSILQVKGEIYHLSWSPRVEKVVEEELLRRGLKMSSTLEPLEGWKKVFEEIGEFLRFGKPSPFEEGYLIVPVAVKLPNDSILVYDPLGNVFTYIGGR